MANKRLHHGHLYYCLGKVINMRRKKLNMSQDELAEESGVNRAFISDIEKGKRNPSVGAVQSIADGLHIRISRMLSSCEECVKQKREEVS